MEVAGKGDTFYSPMNDKLQLKNYEKSDCLSVNLTFNPTEVNARMVQLGKPILILDSYVLMRKEIAVE